MTEAMTKYDSAGAVLEQVITAGDLAALKPAERVAYYRAVCESVGLNPLTRPLEYIKLQGKLTLYARKDATDQLRAIKGVSIRSLDHKLEGELYIVTVVASDERGRMDSDVGAVTIAGLKGEARANAILKAVTKAKRRVTLSLCGLGLLDESEADSIPGAQRVKVRDDGELVDEPEPAPALPPAEYPDEPPPETVQPPPEMEHAFADIIAAMDNPEPNDRADLKTAIQKNLTGELRRRAITRWNQLYGKRSEAAP